MLIQFGGETNKKMEATLQKVQQELKSDEWELRVDGLKALTKLGEETRTPDERQQLAKLSLIHI